MASYRTLYDLMLHPDLFKRAQVAICISAQTMLAGGSPTAAERAWASVVFSNPAGEALKAWRYILAKYNGADVDTILSLEDNVPGGGVDSLQEAVDEVAPALVAALAGI